MHNAIVYSVPGTGTRFCNNFLEYVLDYTVAGNVDKLAEPNTYWQLHIQAGNLERIMQAHPDTKLIVPIRDPYLSFLTRRKADTSGIYTTEKALGNFTEYWKTLIDYTICYPTAFIPIDCSDDDRLRHLEVAANHLGASPTDKLMQYANDWAAIGSLGMNDAKREYIEHGTINGMKPAFFDFVVEWINGLGLEE